MTCSKKSTQQYFQQILNEIKPKARYISQMHVEQFADSIYLQIINGDTQVATEKTPLQGKSQKQGIQDVLRMKILMQAEKQKQVLQQKLSYLANSINALNRYEDLNNRKNSRNLRASYSVGGNRQKQEWRQEIQERGKTIAEKKKAAEEIRLKKMEEMKQMQERIKLQQLQRKKKQISDNVKSIQQRSKKRQQQIKISNERYKKLKKQKSLHNKLQQSYNQKQLSFLQERKKKLAQIRNLHKPLDQLQIKQHQQRFLQNKRQKEEMRQRQKRMNQSRSHSYQPFYKSVFYQRALQDSRNQTQNAQQTKVQKIKQYAQKIKQQFVPEVDQNKRKQIQQFIQKQKKKLQEKAERQKQLKQKHKQKGIQYLQLVKKLPKKARKASADLSAPISQKKQYPNYLSHTQKQQVKPWTQILKSSGDKQQKALMLQIQSQKHQQQLKRKQQQVRLMKKGHSQDIDQQYFEMIKAKLDLLQAN